MDEVTGMERDEAAALEPQVNEAEERLSRMLTPEQMAKIKDATSKIATTEKRTESGSEAVAVDQPNVGKTITGSDVDWSEYELESNLRHLYPKAVLREYNGEPKWVVMLDEFTSAERAWESYGKRVGPEKEPLNLGEYLSDKVNGIEGWVPAVILPGSVGRVGVLMTKKVPFILPDPKPLKKSTEVAAPGDAELQRVEKDALDFIEREGLTPQTPAPEDGPKSLEQRALELNGPAASDPGPLTSRGPIPTEYEVEEDAQ